MTRNIRTSRASGAASRRPASRPSIPSKPRGWGQQAPLTQEYRAVFEDEPSATCQAGGEGLWPGYSCLPPGMPRDDDSVYEPMEIVDHCRRPPTS